MKFGKIYSYKNAEEARKLIGKRVVVSDVFYDLEKTTAVSDDIGTLIIIKENSGYPFSVKFYNEDVISYQFIREIEEDKPKLMTNRQLAEWLAKGNGLWKHEPSYSGLVYHFYWFIEKDMGEEIPNDIVIMYNDSDEWVVPTVDIYERDCKGKGR